MYSKINYTVVGVFVLISSILALAFAFWLARYGFEESYDEYRLYFSEAVDGLTVDSSVKLNGVDVGKVSTIEIDPDNLERVRVTIRLKHDTPIVEGMFATLKLQGITGLSYIQIEGGRRGAARIKAAQGQIPIIPTKESILHRLSKSAPDLLDRLQNTAEGLNRLFSRHHQEQINTILDNTAQATGKALKVEERFLSLSDSFNQAIEEFNKKSAQLIESVDRVSQMLQKKLPSVLDHVDEAGKNIAKLSKEVERRFKQGQYNLRKMLRPIQIDIKELSYSYQELAEDLKDLSRHPSSLIFGSSRPPKGPGE